MMKTNFLSISLLLLFSTGSFSQNSRPQEPKEPYPYALELVEFKNEVDEILLSGTLTLPEGKIDFPTVILISGSGPQDRDSEILGHKPFLVMADHLTKNGIAVLRVDDRGVGGSEGVYNESGLEGFKRDTESAIEFLKTRKEINTDEIGLIGHSLGGVIAPLIASNSKDIGFIILLAGSGIRGDKLMLLQKEIIERKMGLNDEGVEIGQKRIGGAYEIILNSSGNRASLESKLKDYFAEAFGQALPENQLEIIAAQLTVPWLTDFIKFDPAETLSGLECHVLALNGGNDLQVPATENLTAIANAIKKGGNADVTTKELPGLNHLFQDSETGLPAEYGTIEQTFSPEVLRIMTDWINERFN